MLSDPWCFLLLREALLGRRTFAQFRDELGIATDVLTARLNRLVDDGIMTRIPYRESGQRTRYAYALTPAGDELKVVLVALQQWGDRHITSSKGSRITAVASDTGHRVHVSLVDVHGTLVDQADAEFVRADAASALHRDAADHGVTAGKGRG